MATLICVHNSDGLVGRCDARCCNGTDERCTCICGGANHAVGRAAAEDNTRAWAATWAAPHLAAGATVELGQAVEPSLF